MNLFILCMPLPIMPTETNHGEGVCENHNANFILISQRYHVIFLQELAGSECACCQSAGCWAAHRDAI